MTAVLVGALIGALGLVGVLAGALIWLGKRSLGRADERGDLRVGLAEEQNLNRGWQGENEALRNELADSEHRLSREVVARKTAERQRDELLTEAADHGDPNAVASDIKRELERMSE